MQSSHEQLEKPNHEEGNLGRAPWGEGIINHYLIEPVSITVTGELHPDSLDS